jgi:stage II sporulation protein D
MRPLRASLRRRASASLAIVTMFLSLTVASLTVVVGAAVLDPQHASATTIETAPFPASGTIGFHANGNGHGHGMSQYGAEGAALDDLTAAQILAFYYPGTTLNTVAASTIRVKLSSTTKDTTVFAGTAGLTVTSYGALPTTGYTYFRLVPNSTGITLEGEKSATTTWKSLSATLPARSDFSSTAGYVQTLFADGSSTRYHGTIGALRTSATAEITINRVPLDLYTQGVVPREMPSGWKSAAVQAQAVAVRSYAKSEMAGNAGNSYDICDSSDCQVYGGYQHFPAGATSPSWTDDPASIVGNQNQILTYQGAPVFAQFSASNGGATVDGGKPYLIAKVDPYDDTASGDPYLDRPGSVSVATLAADYGLAKITSIQITQRDGIGTWGGRVLAANVIGTTSGGVAKTVATDGFTLADDIGALTNWFRFDTEVPLPTAPTSVKAVAGDAGATISWVAPSNATSAHVSGYRLSFGGHSVTTSSTARSVYIAPIYQNVGEKVTVAAVGSTGMSPPAAITVQGVPAPSAIVPVSPTRLFNTANPSVVVDASHPYSFTVGTTAGVPATATAVQLVVGVIHATEAGVLTVDTSGTATSTVAAIAYGPAGYAASTISIPLVPTSTLVFKPSAGSVAIVASVMSYSTGTGATTGSRIALVAPTVVRKLEAVTTGAGSSVSLASVPGISSTTVGVVVEVDAIASVASGWLRLWSDSSTSAPPVEQIAVSSAASAANTLVVPVTATHRLHLAGSTSSMSARITVIGLVGSTGGLLETFPVNATADDANSAHPAVTVGTTPVAVQVAGVGQVLASGVAAALVEVTVHSPTAGLLYAYPAGGTKPPMPGVRFSAVGSQTSTVLLPIGTDGKVELVSSVPGATVSIDSLGYLTTS